MRSRIDPGILPCGLCRVHKCTIAVPHHEPIVFTGKLGANNSAEHKAADRVWRDVVTDYDPSQQLPYGVAGKQHALGGTIKRVAVGCTVSSSHLIRADHCGTVERTVITGTNGGGRDIHANIEPAQLGTILVAGVFGAFSCSELISDQHTHQLRCKGGGRQLCGPLGPESLCPAC